VLCGSAFFPVCSGRHSLENAVQTTAADISNKINDGTIAVVTISTSNGNLSLQVIRWLENRLVESGKLTIISRQQINAVLNEQKFGLSGYVDDESARRIGHIVGAEYVLSGEIIIVNGTSILNIQVIETETAMLIYSNSFQIEDKQEEPEKSRQYRF
jgi:curli biogenesis system outer membrane secretion channel CsgG